MILASWPPSLMILASWSPGCYLLASFFQNPSPGEGLGQEETTAPGLPQLDIPGTAPTLTWKVTALINLYCQGHRCLLQRGRQSGEIPTSLNHLHLGQSCISVLGSFPSLL